MILNLTSEDKARLKSLSQQKDTLFSLKKLFINTLCERSVSNDITYLAAQKIAFQMLYDIFHDIEVMQPDIEAKTERENLV